MKPVLIIVVAAAVALVALVVWRRAQWPDEPLPAAVADPGPGGAANGPPTAGPTAAPKVVFDGDPSAGVTPTVLRPEDEQARIDAALDLNRRTLLEPYEALSAHDPRWDHQARAAVEAAVTVFSQAEVPYPGTGPTFLAATAAVEAGCDDPLILYLYASTGAGANAPGRDESIRRLVRAAEALRDSNYPALRRVIALALAGNALAGRGHDGDAVQAAPLIDAALRLVPEALHEHGDAPVAFGWAYQAADNAYEAHHILTGDRDAALELVEAALGDDPEVRPLFLRIRGLHLIRDAWDARGSGPAATVPPDAWPIFHDRLAEAGEVLEEAWRLRPDDPHAATTMLTVQRDVGDRDEMERWFERAMEADPDSYKACASKMEWLNPKWHGTSTEAMLAFGRACGASGRWRTSIPLLLPDAYFEIDRYMSRGQARDFFRSQQVWEELQAVYEGHLRYYPDDRARRCEYAIYAYFCYRFSAAQAIFQSLGDELVPTSRFSLEEVRQYRDWVNEAVEQQKSFSSGV